MRHSWIALVIPGSNLQAEPCVKQLSVLCSILLISEKDLIWGTDNIGVTLVRIQTLYPAKPVPVHK